jgi:putative peptidoglycan lipid II flippase
MLKGYPKSPYTEEAPPAAPKDDRSSLKRSSATTVSVMACTMATRVLGFVRTAVVAALFGTTGQADVLNGVFMIPNSFRKLLAEGALSTAFIPILSHSLVKDPGSGSAKDLVRHIVTFLVLLLVPLLILSVVFARPVVGLFLDLPTPELMSDAASLFQYLCHYLLFVSLSAVLMAVLNSHGIFVVPALTPLFFSIAVIGSLLIFYRSLGIYSMAVGVLGGGLFQVVFQAPFFRKEGYDFRPSFRFSQPAFRQTMKLWLPVVATSSVFAVNQLIAVRFASGLAGGSTSVLGYALVIFQLPFGVFSASISTVLFPRMSRQAASEDREGLRNSLNYGLRFLLVVLVPSTLFFLIMGREMVGVIYERGRFGFDDTVLTARILSGYSYGMFSVGAFTFLQRFYYSLKDYKRPFFIAIAVTVLDIGLSLWLKETYLQVVGLAIANSAAFTLGLILMVYFAFRKIGDLGWGSLLLSAARIFGSLILPAGALWGVRHWLSIRGLLSGGLSRLWILLGGFVLFSAAAVFLYYLFRVEMIRDVLAQRLSGRPRRLFIRRKRRKGE